MRVHGSRLKLGVTEWFWRGRLLECFGASVARLAGAALSGVDVGEFEQEHARLMVKSAA